MYESYAKDPLCLAVEAAWKAGIVVVVAAGNDGRDNTVGNDGYGTVQSPANDPYVITVGAMKAMGTYPRTDDLIASYSSKGPSAIDFVVKPDIVAPGNHVVSLEAPNSTLANDPMTTVPLSLLPKHGQQRGIKAVHDAERDQYGDAGGERRHSRHAGRSTLAFAR